MLRPSCRINKSNLAVEKNKLNWFYLLWVHRFAHVGQSPKLNSNDINDALDKETIFETLQMNIWLIIL